MPLLALTFETPCIAETLFETPKEVDAPCSAGVEEEEGFVGFEMSSVSSKPNFSTEVS